MDRRPRPTTARSPRSNVAPAQARHSPGVADVPRGGPAARIAPAHSSAVAVAARMRRYRRRQAAGTVVAPVEATEHRVEVLRQLPAGLRVVEPTPGDIARAIEDVLDWLGSEANGALARIGL
jgi:hypothetical protein